MFSSNTHDFFAMILDCIDHHVAVIDCQGEIQYVNQSWIAYAQQNGCLTQSNWQSVNYLNICQKAAAAGDEFGRDAIKGIKQVINGELQHLELEYPCHSIDDYRWFMMKVSKSACGQTPYFIIIHQDITRSKLAEEKALALANIDGLTNIANRQCFDQVIEDEWRRCQRLLLPLSLLMIDIDHFRLLNENYGHQTGDEFLKILAGKLAGFVKRPGDLYARFGGEEFVIVMSNTYRQDALKIAEAIRVKVQRLEFPNANAPGGIATVSQGLVTVIPQRPQNTAWLIKQTDKQLCQAKNKGRNQVVWEDFVTPDPDF
ncbi:MAG: GGDEF domain-containing protein [Algicola sp.]|nr:GGDEF domain-containing protein [Algicola sp.]